MRLLRSGNIPRPFPPGPRGDCTICRGQKTQRLTAGEAPVGSLQGHEDVLRLVACVLAVSEAHNDLGCVEDCVQALIPDPLPAETGH